MGESHLLYKFKHGRKVELPSADLNVSINAPHLKVGYLGDLSKKSVTELEELLNRQKKLISNKRFLSKLKDGGEQLKNQCKRINNALEGAKLGGSKGGENILPDTGDANFYEWRDPCDVDSILNGRKSPLEAEEEDTDSDSEQDPLKLLASHSCDVPWHTYSKRREEESGPANEIQKELEKLSIQDNTPKADFGSKLIHKLEDMYTRNADIIREPFKPSVPLKRDHIERTSERNPHLWEESSATGPLLKSYNKPVILLPLRNSTELPSSVRENNMDLMIGSPGRILLSSRSSRMKSAVYRYKDVNEDIHFLDNFDWDDLDQHEDEKR